MNFCFIVLFVFFDTDEKEKEKKTKLEIEYNHNLHSNKSANISHQISLFDLFAYRLWKYMQWYIKICFFLLLLLFISRITTILSGKSICHVRYINTSQNVRTFFLVIRINIHLLRPCSINRLCIYIYT